MKFLNKSFLLISLINSVCCYSQITTEDLETKLATIESTVNKVQGKIPLIKALPQISGLLDKVAGPIIDIFNKITLAGIQIAYDSKTKAGCISFSTDIDGIEAGVRLIIGGPTPEKNGVIPGNISRTAQSPFISKTFSQDFTQRVQNFQQQIKEIPSLPTQGIQKAREGATFVAQIPGQIPTIARDLINDSLKTKQASSQTPQVQTQTPTIEQTDQTISPPEQKTPDAIAAWLAKQLTGHNIGVLLILPKGFSFETIYNDLKFLDVLHLDQVGIGLGTGFVDPIFGPIFPGISLIADIGTDVEPFKTIATFFNRMPTPIKVDLSQPFKLRGSIFPLLGGSSFEFQLPGQISFKLGNSQIAQTDSVAIDVTLLPLPTGSFGVGGVAAGLSSGLTINLNAIDSDLSALDFKTFFAVNTALEASITGVMNGMLSLAPIGLPLQFGNITLTLGINPENIETLGLAEVGMAGELDFGSGDNGVSLQTAIDAKLSGQDTNILVYGDLEPKAPRTAALSLKDIVNLTTTAFNDLGIHTQLFNNNIPNLALNHARFYFSPRSVMFANKIWNAGLQLDVGLDIFGVNANLEFAIDGSGFEASGYLSPVNLGPVSIIGIGKGGQCSAHDVCLHSCSQPTAIPTSIINPSLRTIDKKLAFTLNQNNAPKTLQNWTDYSKQTGPIVNILFKPPSNIGMLISAQIEANTGKLGTIKTDACLNISTKGVNIHFEEKIFNVFDAAFTMNAQDFKKPTDWYICALMKQEAMNMLYKEVSNLIHEADEQLKQKLAPLQTGINDAKAAYSSAFDKAQSEIKAAQNNVNSLKSKLDSAKESCAGQKFSEKIGYPYGPPAAFNSEYVVPNYFLLGDISVVGTTSYKANIGGQDLSFIANQKTDTLYAFFTNKEYPNAMRNNPRNYSLLTRKLQHFIETGPADIYLTNNSVNTKLKFLPQKPDMSPINVLITRNNNFITFYTGRLGNQRKGYKVIFNILEFENYMTMTYWYNYVIKNQPNSTKGLAIGFTFNGDILDTIAIPPVTDLININILWGNITMSDISSLPKLKEEGNISYNDLVTANIIRVQPLSSAEFNLLNF